jgi:DNA-binding transcriptional MocR family regulator
MIQGPVVLLILDGVGDGPRNAFDATFQAGMPHLGALRRRYAANIDTVRGLIARHFPPGTRATRPAGGFLLWLELPEGSDALALFHAALAERILITPGALYSGGDRYRHCLRLSCSIAEA